MFQDAGSNQCRLLNSAGNASLPEPDGNLFISRVGRRSQGFDSVSFILKGGGDIGGFEEGEGGRALTNTCVVWAFSAPELFLII